MGPTEYNDVYYVFPQLYKYLNKYHVITDFIFLKHTRTYKFYNPGITSHNSEK